MTDNRDPITCSNCGTVNPWMNEKCRSCNELLVRTQADESEQSAINSAEQNSGLEISTDKVGEPLPKTETQQNKGPTKRKRINVLLILVGALLYVIVYVAGTALTKKMIDSDPKRAAALEEFIKNKDKINDQDKAQYKEPLMPIIVAVFIGALLTPFLIGAGIGFYTQRILEAALAMGATLLYLLLAEGGGGKEALIALILGAINSILAAIGAMAGRFAKKKLADN